VTKKIDIAGIVFQPIGLKTYDTTHILVLKNHRDEDYISKMDKVITEFSKDMIELEDKIKSKYL
jgi:hypothetical protein